mgnify:CR=1 FL=1
MDTDLSQMDFDTLREVDILKIDQTLPKEQRMADFIRQVKNPYCFKVGKVAVSVGFANNGVTFEQQMGYYLQTL